MLTPKFGNACAVADSTPYINHCEVAGKDYDQVGAIFAHIYGSVKPPATNLSGHVVAFDQREFLQPNSGMADEGYAYIPSSCASGASCRIHVAFHGCLQSAQRVGDDFYGKTSYNAWADSNNLIVLFPQIKDSSNWFHYNPKGCWDWWGYSSQDYAVRNGPQMLAIHAMIARLAQHGDATASR